ncbi:uncharacterized protein B0H64DRAFT_123872 [Chaetomium fimeti]|uniref:C2H2-type domain-containing protein n=1 Tax=Chaetomium fimeti TaxID=1854472 RepID=A0AAE0HIV5_9PEZI|nr:hypothetical protein B0H64DRAFT_123872 [Chaetomium fimeti]
MHNQSQIPGTTALHGSTFGADYELMPCPPPDRGRRLSCPTGPNLPSNYNMSVSGPDLTTSHHYTPVGRSVAPAMSPSWDMCGFPSSYAATRDEAAGATASSLGSAASVGGLRYAQIREHVNDGDSSELGSEHGNGRRSQDTEDRYYLHSDDEQGEDGGRTANGPLNCPYRKRNKERFNIRDHVKCTNPFKEFAHLKSHIKTCHKRQRPLIQHEGQVEGDVEDGITEDIDNLLVARKNRHKVSNWEVLWKTLFPLDTKVPSPGMHGLPTLPRIRG